MVAESLSGSTTVCDGVSIEAILREAGTPVYVYDASVVRDRYRELDMAFGDYPHRICYSVKANSNLAVLDLLVRLGSSFTGERPLASGTPGSLTCRASTDC